MRKMILAVLGLLIFFGLIIGFTWVNAYNGAIQKNNAIVEQQGNVHATLSARYEKVGAFIDAIEGANSTVQGYLNTIMAARTAFANAIAAGNVAAANESAATIDGTFITLVSYMEDNPSSYNTVNLYAGFMSEFSAATNVVTNAILTYNSYVTSYNNHIQQFPNSLFVGTRTPYTPYNVSNYNTQLPTFN
jgi:LemA protein